MIGGPGSFYQSPSMPIAGTMASGPGLLFHMARPYNDGVAEYSPYLSLYRMLSDCYIEGQGNKGYFARMDGVKSVSFTASRLEELGRLVERRSQFGICFNKKLIDPSGDEIRPVHYLSRQEIDRIRLECAYPHGLGEEDRNWIDLEEPGTYSFSWEKEWRKMGNLFFEHNSVVFVIAPTSHISAALYALDLPIIPSSAISDPLPHMERVAMLVEEARRRSPKNVVIDEAAVEESYLALLAMQYNELFEGQFEPKIRAEMREDEAREIWTDSGDIRDPDGEWNFFEASMFDLDNMVDSLFEDAD